MCFCEDVQAKDVSQAIGEGFDHIETLKRYTTVTMGPCQGRMCQLAAIGLLRPGDRSRHRRDRRHHLPPPVAGRCRWAPWPGRATTR